MRVLALATPAPRTQPHLQQWPDALTAQEPSNPGGTGEDDDIGGRIRAFRKDQGMTLTDLATTAGVSKSHLSALENGAGARPGAAILHKIAVALGVTIADVIGREVRPQTPTEMPASLLEFAKAQQRPQADIDMLASITFRGEQTPHTRTLGLHLHSHQTSASLDPDE
jgi:XRE family transcriptional regulator of biofilm formation